MPDQLQVHDAERVDTPDMKFLASAPQRSVEQQGGVLLSNPEADLRGYIVSGFEPVINGVDTNKQLRVDRGVAILSRKEGGVVTHGALVSEGEAQRILDMSAFSVAHYAVWLKFTLLEGTFANRLHWDPDEGAEYQDSVTTRLKANWDMRTTQYPGAPSVGTRVNPGPEWTFIGNAEITASEIVVTAERTMYFEGAEADDFVPEWGDGANDRDPDRALYGIHDFRTMAQAFFRKVAEIQSATGDWWDEPDEALDEKLSKSGDNATGVYHFAGDVFTDSGLFTTTPQDIGTSGDPFAHIYGQNLTLKGTFPLLPTVDIRSDVDGSGNGQANVYLRSEDDPSTEFFRLLYNQTGTNFAAVHSSHIIRLAGGNANFSSATTVMVDATEAYPQVDNTVLWGKTANRWSEEHARSVYALMVLPEGSGTSQLGQSGDKFDELNVVAGNIDDLVATEVSSNLIPDANITRDLGSAAKWWDELFVENVYTTLIQHPTVDGDLFILGNGDGDLVLSNTGGRVLLDGNVVVDSEAGTLIKGTGASGDVGEYGVVFYANHSNQAPIELQQDATPSLMIRFNPLGNIGDDVDTDTDPVISEVGPFGLGVRCFGAIRVGIAGVGEYFIPFFA